MSYSYSPIYRLPFALRGSVITETMERVRFTTIDRQLEALFTFLGDGIITNWSITLSDTPETITITPGCGVIVKIACATSTNYNFKLVKDATQNVVYYLYAHSLFHTPYTAAGEIISSTTVYNQQEYLPLGTATISPNGKIMIDMSSTSGRKQLTLLEYLLTSVSKHVHDGNPGDPSKIDLFNHVKGILSAANIEDLPASKITSGVFSKDRFNNQKTNSDLMPRAIAVRLSGKT